MYYDLLHWNVACLKKISVDLGFPRPIFPPFTQEVQLPNTVGFFFVTLLIILLTKITVSWFLFLIPLWRGGGVDSLRLTPLGWSILGLFFRYYFITFATFLQYIIYMLSLVDTLTYSPDSSYYAGSSYYFIPSPTGDSSTSVPQINTGSLPVESRDKRQKIGILELLKHIVTLVSLIEN